MNHQELVSVEVAKKAKEAGFNEPCKEWVTRPNPVSALPMKVCGIPTVQQLQIWMISEKDVYPMADITLDGYKPNLSFRSPASIHSYCADSGYVSKPFNNVYPDYWKAVNAAIEFAFNHDKVRP